MAKSKGTDYTNLGRAWAIGMDLVIYIVAGGLIGFGLDWIFKTGPLLMIVVGILGLAAGVLRFIREAMALNRQMARDARSARGRPEADE